METIIKFTMAFLLMLGTNAYSQKELPLFKSAETPEVGLSLKIR